MSIDIQIYRVYTGRFSNWDEKVLGSTNSSRKASCRHATAIPYPFILRVGEVDSIVEARELIEKL